MGHFERCLRDAFYRYAEDFCRTNYVGVWSIQQIENMIDILVDEAAEYIANKIIDERS